MMTYRFTAAALLELEDGARYYDRCDKGLGDEFIGEIEQAIEQILFFPEGWSRIDEIYRRFHVKRFPYSVVYFIEDEEEIIVVAIFHQERGADTWRNNLD